MLGWDEIVEHGVDSNATVMFWRSWAPKLPAMATANGNDMIMSPDGGYYFDHTPDKNSVYEVYHYNPRDTAYRIKKENLHRIIGVQANLWSETIPTEARADYMILPRMTALSEVGWTYRNLYNSFTGRLIQHYPRLDNLGIQYRLPELDGLLENNLFVTPRKFFIPSPLPYFKIRYTTDGSSPENTSPVLTDSIAINGLSSHFLRQTVTGVIYTISGSPKPLTGKQCHVPPKPWLALVAVFTSAAITVRVGSPAALQKK